MQLETIHTHSINFAYSDSTSNVLDKKQQQEFEQFEAELFHAAQAITWMTLKKSLDSHTD